MQPTGNRLAMLISVHLRRNTWFTANHVTGAQCGYRSRACHLMLTSPIRLEKLCGFCGLIHAVVVVGNHGFPLTFLTTLCSHRPVTLYCFFASFFFKYLEFSEISKLVHLVPCQGQRFSCFVASDSIKLYLNLRLCIVLMPHDCIKLCGCAGAQAFLIKWSLCDEWQTCYKQHAR